jgi:hypothetical protein
MQGTNGGLGDNTSRLGGITHELDPQGVGNFSGNGT